jgi:hypothetical protein
MSNKQNDFFSLPESEQERIKSENPEWGHDYERVLYRSISNLKDMDLDDMHMTEIPKDEELKFNAERLMFYGVGKENLQIISPMLKGKETKDFTTLYDYDYAFYDARVKAMKDITTDLAEYRPQLLDVYVNLNLHGDKNKLRSLFVRTASDKICACMEDEAVALVESLIPHEYESLSDMAEHIEEQGQNFNLLKYRLNANGKEVLLKRLQNSMQKYINNAEMRLSAKFENENIDVIWFEELEWKGDKEIFYYFSNSNMLKKAVLRDFSNSIEEYAENNLKFLHEIQDQEIAKCLLFLKDEYEVLLENFDPNVLSMDELNNEVAVMISDEQFDELVDALDDDYDDDYDDFYEEDNKSTKNDSPFTIITKDDD